jgi:hypothetical protein
MTIAYPKRKLDEVNLLKTLIDIKERLIDTKERLRRIEIAEALKEQPNGSRLFVLDGDYRRRRKRASVRVRRGSRMRVPACGR